MARLRVHNFAISLDGYCAGLNQSREKPFGEVEAPGPSLHDWMLATASGQRMLGNSGGTEGVDEAFVAAGATIIGRNMFGPIRGSWDGDEWKGWWGDTPPYHHLVFVLTHHSRASIPMQGGTTFHFVTDGIDTALARAFEAAEGADVRVGGGASTIQQYLRAGLIDEMHIAIVPILIGAGERLFDHLDAGPGSSVDGYECVEFVQSESVAHARIVRTT